MGKAQIRTKNPPKTSALEWSPAMVRKKDKVVKELGPSQHGSE